MIRFTLTTFAAAMLALSMSGARTSASDIQDPGCNGGPKPVPVLIADCNAGNPNCDRPVPAGVKVACDLADPNCSDRTVPVLIANCNIGDPGCGRTVPAAVKVACDKNGPGCHRRVPATKMIG